VKEREDMSDAKEIVSRAGEERNPRPQSAGKSSCGVTPDGTAKWLTRSEWNVCYFLGQEAFFRQGLECGLCEQVAVGIDRLLAAGYQFERLQVGPSGRLEPVASETREHDQSCTQVSQGNFDDIGRAREALHWLRTHAPQVSTSWVENLLTAYDRVHPPDGLAPGTVN
jgi:hypothetical protein